MDLRRARPGLAGRHRQPGGEIGGRADLRRRRTHLVPPVAAAHRTTAAPGRYPPDRRGQRRLPWQPARRPAAPRPRPARRPPRSTACARGSPSARILVAPQRLRRSRGAPTARRPRHHRHNPLCRTAPGRVRPSPRLARRPLHRTHRGADASRAPGAGHRQPSRTPVDRVGRGPPGLDLGGRTDLATLAGVLAGADAVVVGNTGPAHLAAAVGTPVVSLFAPVVPARKWAPYQVPHVLLGDQQAPAATPGRGSAPCPATPA